MSEIATTTPDFYAVLGVARSADSAAIKAAYRRRAADHHPDVGGRPEDFHILALAYEVLSNPEDRQHYDLTGESPADRAARRAEDARFRTLASDFLVTIIANSGAPEFNDIAALARQSVAQQIHSADALIAQTEGLIHRVAESNARLHSRAGDHLLNDILSDKLQDLRNTIAQTRQQRARWLRLAQMLEDYGYELFDESLP